MSIPRHDCDKPQIKNTNIYIVLHMLGYKDMINSSLTAGSPHTSEVEPKSSSIPLR